METRKISLQALRIFATLCRRDPRAGRYTGLAATTTGEPKIVFLDQPDQDTKLRAVFLPSNPEDLVFDMNDTVRHALSRGMRLYTNAAGRRALMKKPLPGWQRYGSNAHVRGTPPCAA